MFEQGNADLSQKMMRARVAFQVGQFSTLIVFSRIVQI
jgi:hypothetical protein